MLYTGDFRTSEMALAAVRERLGEDGQLDLLITEGTNIRPGKQEMTGKFQGEAWIEHRLTGRLRVHQGQGTVFVLCSSANEDRIQAFTRGVARFGRTVCEDLFQSAVRGHTDENVQWFVANPVEKGSRAWPYFETLYQQKALVGAETLARLPGQKLIFVRTSMLPFMEKYMAARLPQTRFDLQPLRCYRSIQDSRKLVRSLGTLGGGNHFIEVDRTADGTLYLVIHSGSRNLGKQVAEYYQKLAVDLHSGKEQYFQKKAALIAEYKAAGRRDELQQAVKGLRWTRKELTIPEDLCYVYGSYFSDYLADVEICQQFAKKNRELIAEILMDRAGLKGGEAFHTVHNYIDVEEKILRKGAVSAKRGELLLIPVSGMEASWRQGGEIRSGMIPRLTGQGGSCPERRPGARWIWKRTGGRWRESIPHP